MKKKLLYISLLLLLCFGCKKKSGSDDTVFTVTPYAPVAVTKSFSKKVFVHVMPWFESKSTNGNGKWGTHWTMTNRNPEIIDGNGQRQIASHYYPLIGPYASGDTAVIEYQLLLMKLSGIDGVCIDWPGKQNLNDYPFLVRNTEKIIDKLNRVGLNFIIVYEDQNLAQAGDDNSKLIAAKNDMQYLQNNYFQKSFYEKLNNKPMLFVFGPQVIDNQGDLKWSTVFSVLPAQPAFFTLWNESPDAGGAATGEFAWIYKNNLSNLNSFYNNNYAGVKIASAYPGFHSYYAEGGYGGPTWQIPYGSGADNTVTFSETLALALSKNYAYTQLNTWNDYGEGTMIEPTKEFGYSFLNIVQEQLGVSSIQQSDLEMVNTFYQLRKSKSGDTNAQKKLDQVFYYIVSLQLDKAEELLSAI